MDVTPPDNAATGYLNAALALFAILVLALLLRVFNLPWESPALDETRVIAQLESATFAGFRDNFAQLDPKVRLTPLPYFALNLWSRALGDSVPALRMFPVVCSVGMLWLVFLIAQRIHGTGAALAAAALAAVSLPHIFQAQEIGPHAMLTLVALGSMYFFLRAVQGGGAISWGALLILDALMPWTHPAAALVWIAQAAFLVKCRREWPARILAWGLAHAGILGLFGAWIALSGHELVPERTAAALAPRDLLDLFLVFAGGRFSNADPALYMPGGASFDRLLAAGIALVLLAELVRSVREIRGPDTLDDIRRAAAESCFLWTTWALLPPAALAIANLAWGQAFDWRLVLFASFALYLPVGRMLTSGPPPAARAVLAATFIALFAAQLTVIPGGLRPDYRSAADFLLTNGQPSDRILVFGADNAEALLFDSPMSRQRIESFSDPDALIGRASNQLVNSSGVWMVLCGVPGTIESGLKAREIGFKRFEFGGHPPVRVYWLRWDEPSGEPMIARAVSHEGRPYRL